MRHTFSTSVGVAAGLLLVAPMASGADDAGPPRESNPVTAEVNLISRLVPSDFTLVLDPDPANPDAKLEILKYARGNRYRLDVAPALGDRAEIYLVAPSKYRVYNPRYGQYSPVLAGRGDIGFKVKRVHPLSSARSLTFWKHQVNTYLKGNGDGEETRETMMDGYPRRIETEFPDNALAGPEAQPLTLRSMHRIFAVADKDDYLTQAKQQYLALLLNTASGKISREDEIDDGGSTVSDAIRYLGVLIKDDSRKNDDDAANLATRINEALEVKSGLIPQICLRPVSARLDSGQEIQVFRHDGEEIEGRFSGLALEKELLTMTVVTDGGDQPYELPGNEIARIQYKEEGSVSAGAVIGGFLLGMVIGAVVGGALADDHSSTDFDFTPPPEPFIGAGIGAVFGLFTGAAISSMDDTRRIECEDGLATKTP